MPANILIIVIVVGAVALVLGAIAGYVGGLLESRLNKTLDESREITDPDDPNYKEPEPVVTVHDILKVNIDEKLKLHLLLDGVDLEPDGLTAEQRARLVNVIMQIRPWIDGKTVASAEPLLPILPPAPEPKISTFPTFSMPQVAQATPTPPPKRINPLLGFRTLVESEVKKPEPLLQNNIISLIDEVLQKKLETSPLSDKKIRLEAGPIGEVIVYVGSARYSGVDEVPDPAIRSIIQDAIAQWNKQ